MLAVAYSFGFRKGELLQMRTRQVDLLNRTITLDYAQERQTCIGFSWIVVFALPEVRPWSINQNRRGPREMGGADLSRLEAFGSQKHGPERCSRTCVHGDLRAQDSGSI